MTYIAIAAWDGDNIVIAEAQAEDEASAVEAVATMKAEGFSEAFYASLPTNPDQIGPYVVDPILKTVIRDAVQGNAAKDLQSLDSLRRERNALLASSDWTQGADSPLTDEVQASWATYRQELRDLPASTEDPANPTWPSAPE